MKRTVSILLVFATALALVLFALCSCGSKTARIGIGIISEIPTAENAKADENGYTEVVCTAAAVAVSKDGIITHLAIDTLEASVEFTSSGKTVIKEYKTKAEQGEDYGMKPASPIGREWYEQRDAFVTQALGKSISELKALAASDGKPSSELTKAGCTINVGDFIAAVEKAEKNALAANISKTDVLSFDISAKASGKDADESTDGSVMLAIAAAAECKAEGGEATAKAQASISPKISFTVSGENKTDKKQSLIEKLENMMDMDSQS